MRVNGCAHLLVALATANTDSQPRRFAFSVQHFIVFVLAALHAIFNGAETLGSFEFVAAFDLAQVSFRMNVLVGCIISKFFRDQLLQGFLSAFFALKL